MGWLKDFWDAGPFAGSKGDGYDRGTARAAKEHGVSYEEEARGRAEAEKHMFEGGFYKPGAPSKDPTNKPQ